MRLALIALPFCALFWAPAVLAQQRQVDALTVSLDSTQLGSRDCSKNFILTIRPLRVGQPVPGLGDSWDVTVARGNTSCENGDPLNVTPQEEAGNAGTYRATIKGSEIFETATGETCPTDDVLETVKVCAVWTNDDDSRVSASVKLEIDTTVPDRPRVTKIQPGDGALHVSFEPAGDGDVGSWQICHQLVGPAEEGISSPGPSPSRRAPAGRSAVAAAAGPSVARVAASAEPVEGSEAPAETSAASVAMGASAVKAGPAVMVASAAKAAREAMAVPEARISFRIAASATWPAPSGTSAWVA
jgi:hypothetical protein